MKQRILWLVLALLGWGIWRWVYLRLFRSAEPMATSQPTWVTPTHQTLLPTPNPTPMPLEDMATPSTALDPVTQQALPEDSQVLLDTIPDAPAPAAEPEADQRDALRDAILGDDATPSSGTPAAAESVETEDDTHDDSENGIMAYCVRCKTKRVMHDVSYETTDNGRSGARGVCSECGGGMFTFLKET